MHTRATCFSRINKSVKSKGFAVATDAQACTFCDLIYRRAVKNEELFAMELAPRVTTHNSLMICYVVYKSASATRLDKITI